MSVLASVLIIVWVAAAKLLPKSDQVAELKATVDRQTELLQELNSRLEVATRMLEQRSSVALGRHEATDEVAQLV